MDIQLRDIQVKNLFSIEKMHIRSGEKILIQGPSGKGKTTLLHLMAGILKPDAGSVLIGEHDLYQMPDRVLSEFRLQRVGLIYQKFNLIDHLHARENMALTAPHKSPSQIQAVLEKLGLGNHSDRWVSLLSLGEQQRVAIGRLLLQEPKILLADEPTSSLDRENSEKVMTLLLQAAQDKTLLVVSHDERIQKHFDRVLNFTSLVKEISP